MEEPGAVALVGPGRAGVTVTAALAARGWTVTAVAGRAISGASTRRAAERLHAPARPIAESGEGADLVVVATPDAVVDRAAATVAPSVSADALVLHLSGARGLDALRAVRARRASLHPLQTIPTVELGLARLAGSWAAVTGDPQAEELARQIGLRPFALADSDRPAYHAAATIASNHLVALLAQVERVTPVPLEAFLPLVRATVDNVETLGSTGALTGPVARGDVDTVRAHLAALSPSEHDGYRAMARAAHRLVADHHPDLDPVLA